MDGWQLIRDGDIESGLAILREEYRQSPRNPPRAMRLGITLLWVEAYREAHDHFLQFVETMGMQMDIAYALAGTAQWCQGEPDAAVTVWQQGLRCDHADGAGGVTIPLLLYFAAARHPELVGLQLAIEWLREKTEQGRIKNWPGQYAFYMLDQMSREQVSEANQQTARDQEDARLLFGLKLEFWAGVKAEASGRHDIFLRAMSRVSRLDWDDFDRDRMLFLDQIRCPEFFLARHEASQLSDG